jgi:RNA polymerase sporulation-specific sigma factor
MFGRFDVMDVSGITNEQIAKAREFDNSTINFIFEQFKPFIKNLAFKYFLVGADKDDVMQEAMIGLFLAIKNYNSEKNVSFECF